MTQLRAFGAFTGPGYGDFTKHAISQPFTQPRAFGTFTGGRYGSFAGKTAGNTAHQDSGGIWKIAFERRQTQERWAFIRRIETERVAAEKKKADAAEEARRQAAALEAEAQTVTLPALFVPARSPETVESIGLQPNKPAVEETPAVTLIAAQLADIEAAQVALAREQQVAVIERDRRNNQRAALLTALLLTQH